jgi:hypothetical protein
MESITEVLNRRIAERGGPPLIPSDVGAAPTRVQPDSHTTHVVDGALIAAQAKVAELTGVPTSTYISRGGTTDLAEPIATETLTGPVSRPAEPTFRSGVSQGGQIVDIGD